MDHVSPLMIYLLDSTFSCGFHVIFPAFSVAKTTLESDEGEVFIQLNNPSWPTSSCMGKYRIKNKMQYSNSSQNFSFREQGTYVDSV